MLDIEVKYFVITIFLILAVIFRSESNAIAQNRITMFDGDWWNKSGNQLYKGHNQIIIWLIRFPLSFLMNGWHLMESLEIICYIWVGKLLINGYHFDFGTIVLMIATYGFMGGVFSLFFNLRSSKNDKSNKYIT